MGDFVNLEEGRKFIIESLGYNVDDFVKETRLYLNKSLKGPLGSVALLSFRITRIDVMVALMVYDFLYDVLQEKGKATVLDPTCGKNVLFKRTKGILEKLGVQVIQCDIDEENVCGRTCDVFDLDSMKQIVGEKVDLIVYDPPYIPLSVVPTKTNLRKYYHKIENGAAQSMDDIKKYFSCELFRNLFSIADKVLLKYSEEFYVKNNGNWKYVHTHDVFDVFKCDFIDVRGNVRVYYGQVNYRRLAILSARLHSTDQKRRLVFLTHTNFAFLERKK